MSLKIPLFPLKTVLFPGGVLPLRIFEPRYLDMVSNCLKEESGVGVVLIRGGREVGNAADTHDVGTLSYIDYWHRRNDGLLGVTLAGRQRFKILSRKVQPDQLVMAEVELLPAAKLHPISEEYLHLVEILQNIMGQIGVPYSRLSKAYDDANWVSARLVELLPIPLLDKQRLLLIDDVEGCMQAITDMLDKLEL